MTMRRLGEILPPPGDDAASRGDVVPFPGAGERAGRKDAAEAPAGAASGAGDTACTICGGERFHSHRRRGAAAGRMAGAIALQAAAR